MSQSKKRSLWMNDEENERILHYCEQMKKTKAELIMYLLDKFEEGNLLSKMRDEEQVKLLRANKKIVDDLHDNQRIIMDALNTICEINGYTNFVSLDEQQTYILNEATKHLKENKTKAIVKSYEEQKKNG